MKARDPLTYRGARRNSFFGRKPQGNTKPRERAALGRIGPGARRRDLLAAQRALDVRLSAAAS